MSTFSWQAWPTKEHFGSIADGTGRLSMVDDVEEESCGTDVLNRREARYADVSGGRQLSVVEMDGEGEVEEPCGVDVMLGREATKLAVSDGRSYSEVRSEEEGTVGGVGSSASPMIFEFVGEDIVTIGKLSCWDAWGRGRARCRTCGFKS